MGAMLKPGTGQNEAGADEVAEMLSMSHRRSVPKRARAEGTSATTGGKIKVGDGIRTS